MLKQRGVIDFNANIRLHPEGRSRHGYSRHSYRPVARWHNARFFCVSTVRHVLLPKDGVCRRGSVVDRGSTSLSLSFDPITRRASSIAVIRAINRACDRFHLCSFESVRVRTVVLREERRKIRSNVSRRNEAKLDAGFANEGEREETRLKVRPRDYARSKGDEMEKKFSRGPV